MQRINAIIRWIALIATTCLLIFCMPGISDADVIYPAGRFPFTLDYQLAYQAIVQSGDLSQLPPVGPYYHSTFTEVPDKNLLSVGMEFSEPITDDKLRLISLATEKVQMQRHEPSQDLISLTGGLRYQPSTYFGTLVLFGLDRAKAIDPFYTGKKWRGLAGDIETSAIYFKKDGLSITLGRQRVFWGSQPANLILSETADPLDLFSVRYRKGKLYFVFLFARLDQSRPDSTDIERLPNRTFIDNRYLVGHRLDVQLTRGFRLGLFETSLFGGEGRAPELYYLNPLQFFHTAQLNENEDDNTILGLDFILLPHPGYSVYGQLIVDDFQIDRQSQGDQEPNEIGYMLGLFRAGRTKSFSPDLKLEYVKITNRTYHQADPRNRYLYRNKLLGHPLGPDADSLSFTIGFWPGNHQHIEIETAYRRHGEGSIYKPWDQPWTEVEGNYHESFPTGLVEKAFFVAISIGGYVPLSRYTSDHLFIALDAGYGSVKNHLNIEGSSSSIAWLNVSVGWLGYLELDLGE